MYYDALTLAAIQDELRECLLGGRVQRIIQLSAREVGLEIYAGRRHQLLISAKAESARVLLAEPKLRRGVETPSPLHLLLVKHQRGARLEAISQPAFERILRLTFSGASGELNIICEIMGRYSNIILVNADDVVMESIKRVPASLNRYRTTLPQYSYVPPPPQKRESPLLVTTGLLERACEQHTGPLWRCLVNAIAGISPLLAREIVFRALGNLELPGPLQRKDYVALLYALDELMRLPETHAWSPCVAFEGEGGNRHAVAYAPYELTHLPDIKSLDSMSQAIAQVATTRRSADAYRQVRQRLYSLVDEQIARQEARLASLRRSLVPDAEIEALKNRAQAILAMSWAIEPGQRELVVDPAQVGIDETNSTIGQMSIPLDPELSPSENSQKLFRKYRKIKAAAAQVPRIIRRVELELTYLWQLRAEVGMAENRPQLDAVEGALRECGLVSRCRLPARKKKKSPSRKSQPLRIRAQDNTLILVGRNSRENDEVTFRSSSPDDVWLHAHGVPGSHVIIKCGGQPVKRETLTLAARLAAYYSTARGEPRVQVDFTARRYVRHIKGGRPGMVTYSHEDSVTVAAEVDHVLPTHPEGE